MQSMMPLGAETLTNQITPMIYEREQQSEAVGGRGDATREQWTCCGWKSICRIQGSFSADLSEGVLVIQAKDFDDLNLSRWFDVNSMSKKYQMRVKNTKYEWKIPNASKIYQTRVKNTKCEWKIPNASEKYQTRVKNTKREWKVQNASEKYQMRLKSTKRE